MLGTYQGMSLGEMENKIGTIGQCGELCDNDAHCKSFEYNRKDEQCKLNHKESPTTNKAYQHFVFCQRVGGVKQKVTICQWILLKFIIFTCFCIESDFKCPDGWKKQSGREVGGGGLVGGLSDYSMVDCMRLCASRPEDCNTFQYSHIRRHCKLLNDTKPAKNQNYQEFVYCTKGWITCF